MSDRDFEIEHRWKEEVLYWEGRRGVSFAAGWGVTPPVVYVPTAEAWDASTPDWLHGRRDEVVARLVERSGHRVEDDTVPPDRQRVPVVSR